MEYGSTLYNSLGFNKVATIDKYIERGMCTYIAAVELPPAARVLMCTCMVCTGWQGTCLVLSFHVVLDVTKASNSQGRQCDMVSN